MSNDLPDFVFNLELLRLDHNAKKHCTCLGANIVVDSVNRLVHCDGCGAVLDPFDALLRLARSRDAMKQEVENLLAQRKQIAEYKPWLVTIKRIEQHYRGRRMLPKCPHCHNAFYLEELTTWINAEYEERRRAMEKQGRGDDE